MSANEAVEEKSGRRRRRRRGENDTTDEVMDAEEAEERGLTERKGYATPSRRKAGRRNTRGGEVVESGGGGIGGFFGGIREYFVGVQDELSKVVWPTREELIRLSRLVLAATIASSLVLGAFSFAFTELFILGFEQEWVFAAFFGLVGAGTLLYMRRRQQQQELEPYDRIR